MAWHDRRNAPPPVFAALTDAQRATFTAWNRSWLDRRFRTGPLDEAEWATVEAAARAYYRFAGEREPACVLLARSPLAATVTAFVANEVALAVRDTGPPPEPGDWFSELFDANLRYGLADGVAEAVGAGIAAALRVGVRPEVVAAVERANSRVSHGVMLGGGATGILMDDTQTHMYNTPVGDALHDVVAPAVLDEVASAVRSGGPSGHWTGNGIPGRVQRQAVWSVPEGLAAELGNDCPRWWREPVSAGLRRARRQGADHKNWLGGNLSCYWQPYQAWFREVAGVRLPDGLWQREQARRDLCLSGPGWFFRHLCVISDRPTVLRVEIGDDTEALHCADGPAIAWADGFALYFWHGLAVPAGLVEGDGWPVERIHREANTEIRRAAIERIGWAAYIERAGLRAVASAPDPGNAPHRLELYDPPPGVAPNARILLMTNGSPERSGRRPRYAELVPADIDDPITAAAWQYGCDPELYARLERRT
jgi:hypothetical protein